MDALIKMLKENGNTHGYSFGESMIAKTIETSPCVTDIARMDRVKCNEQARHENQHESSPAPVGANQSPHLDREGGRESETQEDGQDGAGLSEEEEESVSVSHNQGEQSQEDEEHQSGVQEPSTQDE
ncbi:hypothetical protein IGI04_042488, partial [Brassica rapa subsp. trilocularis]